MASLDYDKLPQQLRGGMYRYIEFGVLPGDFLVSVLSNDLRRSCEYADEQNRSRLFDIVYWLYNEAPSPCWGSAERIKAWVEARAPDREKATPDAFARIP